MLLIAWLKRLSGFRLIALGLVTLALTVALGTHFSVKVQAQSEPIALSSLLPEHWEVIPEPLPNVNPINYESGGTRCPGCTLDDKLPRSLIPVSEMGKTLAEYPTIYWYMPKTMAWGVEFTLWDANKKVVYSTTYPFPHYTEKTGDSGYEDEFVVGAPGIMNFTLPASATAPLKIDQQYHWQLRIKCDEIDASKDLYLNGGIERVRVSPTLVKTLKQLTPEERIGVYADERLWYETLETLIQLQRDRPNDQNIIDAWHKLLKSVEISEDIELLS